jgi:hypothetical protein
LPIEVFNTTASLLSLRLLCLGLLVVVG